MDNLTLNEIRCYNFKIRRKELHLTQKQVAERLGVSQVVIAQYETGRVLFDRMYSGKLYQLAKILQVDMEYLLCDKIQSYEDWCMENKGEYVKYYDFVKKLKIDLLSI